MTDRIVIGPRLAVSRFTSGDERGLVLWIGNGQGSWTPLGRIDSSSGHVVDVDKLTVTPSIVAGSWHGYLTDGKWTDA